jgi:lysophospholipase L1-like esterase
MSRCRLWPIAITVAVALGAVTSAKAQYQSSPPRRTVPERPIPGILGRFRAELVPALMEDFGELYIYAPADRALAPPRAGEARVVFIGDSITDRWDLGKSFPGRPYVNRGIGSQVTSQMVLRFHQDVIALHPSVVVILAGVNDVQGFLQKETPEGIESNYEAMADMADRHGIRPVFGSILPVNNYAPGATDVVTERHPDELRRINVWLRAFCKSRHYGYADYYAALVDDRGLMRRDLTEDGVHPLDAGYALMAPIAAAAIDLALRSRPLNPMRRRETW